MKIATLIARILLGLLFLVFGLNGFLHFIPMKLADWPRGAVYGRAVCFALSGCGVFAAD